MNSNSFRDRIQAWDAAIRGGQLASIRPQLEQILVSDVPRSLRAKFAQILIRAGLARKALKVLISVVRSGPDIRPDSSVGDRLAYALALIREGLSAEANQFLEMVPDQRPEKHLYLGYLHQTMWNYSEAVPNLRRYLAMADVSDYERAIAKVNLLASLIETGEFQEAEAIAETLRQEASCHNWGLLTSNLAELTAQMACRQKQWNRARVALAEVESSLAGKSNISGLFVQKWKAFAELFESGSPSAVSAVRSVRQKANELQHWETVRDCDRAVAEVSRDVDLFQFVYFGTPHSSFRKDMQNRCSSWFTPPDHFLLGKSNTQELDLSSGRINGNETLFKPGQLLHRCLIALIQDFYRPVSLGNFYAHAFPGEYFNAHTSPIKVATAISRLRARLASNNLSIQIEVKDQAFMAFVDAAKLTIRLSNPDLRTSQLDLSVSGFLSVMREQNGTRPFTSKDVQNLLKISRASAVRLLDKCVQCRQVTRNGMARSTFYRIA
ncbi:MAG: hypothetical protein AB7F86_06930 [Bdellovibrionales bacterium]